MWYNPGSPSEECNEPSKIARVWLPMMYEVNVSSIRMIKSFSTVRNLPI